MDVELRPVAFQRPSESDVEGVDGIVEGVDWVLVL